MAIDKIQSESINLADNFAFTGTVTGAGEANTPYFYAHTDDGQSISGSTNVKIQYNTEVLDTDSAYDPSTNHRFTVPTGKGGVYFLSACFRIHSTSDFDNCQFKFYKNGSEIVSHNLYHHHYETRQGNIILDLDAGDYIEVYTYLGSGENLTTSYASNYFYGYRIKST